MAIKASIIRHIAKRRIHAKVEGKNVTLNWPANVALPEPGKDVEIAGRDWIDANADPIKEAEQLEERQEAATADADKK